MSLFEALMLVCFGLSWPFSIVKALRTRQVAGKSAVFLSIVFSGYVCGIVHKLLHSPDWIMGLYVLNASMVAFDLVLYLRFSRPGFQPRSGTTAASACKSSSCV